jgi:hypothetical protein
VTRRHLSDFEKPAMNPGQAQMDASQDAANGTVGPRDALDEAAQRVIGAMELWVDAAMDHLADGVPNLTEVNRLENAASAAWSGFTGATARVLLGLPPGPAGTVRHR